MKGIYNLLLLLSLWCICAEANWELHVRIHSYSHLESQRDWQGNHCDPFPNDPCENYFIFCLQSHGWSQTSNFCLYGQYDARNRIITSSSATFPDGQNIFAQGIDNPLIFRGDTGEAWIQRFQFQMRVEDDDPIESNDLIDRVFVVSNGLAISDSFTSLQTYTGIYNNVQADISYRAVCQQNYYGSQCTTFCVGRDDNTGHYECNSEGQPECLEGWTNLATNCLTPICPAGCPANSQCTAPGQCTCLAGWSGDSCDQCIPATGCVHGNCSVPGECVCDAGYSGTLCTIDIDVCGHQSPCENNGTCTNTGPDAHSCDCPPQFHGPNCEEDVDECTTSNPCLNGATCMNHHGTFSCLCAAGYTGQDCGTEIDECSPAPCQNGGTCLDLLDDFNCTCPEGFTGAVCDVDINDCVHPDLCLHGGTCIDQVGGYVCSCLPRYTGRQCEEEKPSPCSSSPCPANTFCVEDIDANTYTCEECQQGFEGCNVIVIVDPSQQGGNRTDVRPVNGMLIGGVVGGVVGALLLLCLVVAIVIACVKCCTCCPCVKLKHTEVDRYHAIDGDARQNPLYLGTSTLLSSQSGTLRSSSNSMPRYDGGSPHYAELSTVASGEEGIDFAPPSRQHSNPMYALAQAEIYKNGTPPTLPAPRRGSGGRPVSPVHSPHYEHIPADMPNSTAPQESVPVASGKYDRLIKPEAGGQVAASGKYDSLAGPTTQAKDNPYVINREDGYKVLPGNPRPAEDVSMETKSEAVNTSPPSTNFNPYDSK